MGGVPAKDPLLTKKTVMKNPAQGVSFHFLYLPKSNLNFTGVSIEGSTEVCKTRWGTTCLTRSQVSTQIQFSYFGTGNGQLIILSFFRLKILPVTHSIVGTDLPKLHALPNMAGIA